MFCSNCGKEVDEKAVVCVHCGCAVNNANTLENNKKTFIATLLLCLFAGGLGAHRFYTGHIGTGVAMLLLTIFSPLTLCISLIVVAIWWLVDLIRIAAGSFKTANGEDLRQ